MSGRPGLGWYDRDGALIEGTDAPIGSTRWHDALTRVSKLLDDPDYKRVAEATIGDLWISTVWIGLDMRFFGDGPPVIFETMIFRRERDEPGGAGVDDFGGEWDGKAWRYSTEAEAIAGHAHVVTMVELDAQLRGIDVGAGDPPERPTRAD